MFLCARHQPFYFFFARLWVLVPYALSFCFNLFEAKFAYLSNGLKHFWQTKRQNKLKIKSRKVFGGGWYFLKNILCINWWKVEQSMNLDFHYLSKVFLYGEVRLL